MDTVDGMACTLAARVEGAVGADVVDDEWSWDTVTTVVAAMSGAVAEVRPGWGAAAARLGGMGYVLVVDHGSVVDPDHGDDHTSDRLEVADAAVTVIDLGTTAGGEVWRLDGQELIVPSAPGVGRRMVRRLAVAVARRVVEA